MEPRFEEMVYAPALRAAQPPPAAGGPVPPVGSVSRTPSGRVFHYGSNASSRAGSQSASRSGSVSSSRVASAASSRAVSRSASRRESPERECARGGVLSIPAPVLSIPRDPTSTAAARRSSFIIGELSNEAAQRAQEVKVNGAMAKRGSSMFANLQSAEDVHRFYSPAIAVAPPAQVSHGKGKTPLYYGAVQPKAIEFAQEVFTAKTSIVD